MVERTVDANCLWADQTQGGTLGDAGAHRRASLEDPVGLWANGAVAAREQVGGGRIEGFGAVASSNVGGVPILN